MTHRDWKTSDFDFELPEALIAQRPSARRGASTLMCLMPGHEARFTSFERIASLFRGDECLIINDTRVVPARLHGQKPTGARVEVFFLEIAHPDARDLETLSGDLKIHHMGGDHQEERYDLYIWAMTRGKLKLGNEVELALGARARLLHRDENGKALLGLKLPPVQSQEEPDAQSNIDAGSRSEPRLWSWLEEVGKLPPPPYIQRDPDADDYERYQTVFAREPGAVAAPTAGLHFTDELLEALRTRGVSIGTVTLHVGPGTFLPVKSEDLTGHVMHHERYQVPLETQEMLRSGRPIVAVGTTVVRALESFAARVESDATVWGDTSEQSTDIFITPGYTWRVVDGLLTNFHLPQSTLLMLVASFVGYERALQAYRDAVERQLKFYSYGDASLLWRPDGAWTPPQHFNQHF